MIDGSQLQPFEFATDRFAFANESSWNENEGASVFETQPSNGRKGADGKRRIYRKRCYVMTRSAIQFWKFARFDRGAEPVCVDEMIDRIRVLRRLPAADPASPRDERIAFPGFTSLYEFSREHAGPLREHLGPGWSTYLRPGNLRMLVPPTRRRQQALCDRLTRALDRGTAVPLWLFTFPNFLMTHSVVAFRSRVEGSGRTVFTVYDPNYRSCPKRLTFRADTQRFTYQRTYFFRGGKIDVDSVYPIANGLNGNGRQSASGSLTT